MSVTPGCAWHWMPHWATDQKPCAAHPPCFSLMPFFFRWLPTFLNQPSPIWWEPLLSTPYTNEPSPYDCFMVVCISDFGSFSFSLLSPPFISLQNPCMETLQKNLCLTAVPVEQQSTESPSMGTGQRRFIPKTTHVSTDFSLSSAPLHLKNEPSDVPYKN